MPTYFIHLENALKRANEFIEVQNKHRALEILCDVLHSKKHRTWQKKHEEIMIKYLELCVELKQSYVAKEGIYQYKIICQQSYISSFEDVIRKYIEMAENKANQAKEESQINISDIDDLENAQTPEDILMGAVSNEGSQDRKDRVVLIPWVKFLWESYRQCLDLLRHNNKTERLYHDIAHQAFKFCIKYNRKSEFRKLCDHLHLHLDQLKRQQTQQTSTQSQQNSINLNSPDSQAMQLETRLIQLDFAIQLELWQEAYKATDDIKKFNLMNLTKKGVGKPQLIASYYQKLSLVFWKANSPLFHAAALFRLFHLSRDLRKNITNEDIQKMASRLVLATLSIPIPAIRPEIDKLVDTEENIIDLHHRNLSMLLGITSKPPTRASLIKDLKRMGVLQFASQTIQDLYQLLEVEFNPLGICGRVQQIIDYIEKSTADAAAATESMDLPQYIPLLKEITVVRLIREVAQIYRTIEFTRLLELCPFVDSIYLEKIIVESARRHDLQVRVDHRRGCFVFGTELRVAAGDEYVEGPYLQSMPNEQMRRQLVAMYSSLHKALNLIEADSIKQQREDMKRQTMASYFKHADSEHMNILNRQNIIEERKELIEKLGIQREMDEQKRREIEEARRREAEQIRMKEENLERERLRREKNEQDLRKQIAMDQIKRMKDQMPELVLEDMDEEELAKLRPQDLQAKRVEQLEKERREQIIKQKKLERKVDHFERAKRIEEIPLLLADYEEWCVTDRVIWDECELLRIEATKVERELALKERERFRRVLTDKEEFNRRVLETRHSEYVAKNKAFDAIVAEERKKRMIQRREKRIEERRVRYYKEKEEVERKRRQEEEQKESARLAEMAEIQARRLQEIEQKYMQNQKEGRGNAESNDKESAPRTITREREPQKEENEPSSWRRAPKKVDDEEMKRERPERERPERERSDRERSERDPPVRSLAAQPKRDVPNSAADQDGDWRRGPATTAAAPAPEGDRDGEGRRAPYPGRYSEGGRSRQYDREAPDSDRREPPPYGGRDSDSGPRRNDRFGPPRERGSGFGDRERSGFGGDRDRRRDEGPSMRGDRDRDDYRARPQQAARPETDSWRTSRPRYDGRDSDRDRPQKPAPEVDGEEDDSAGWRKVGHARKAPGQAGPPGPTRGGDREGPRYDRGGGGGGGDRPRYGGRDSRELGREGPPRPSARR